MAVAFDDDNRDTEPAGGSVTYKCRRCGETVSEGPHTDVATALRRALEHAPTIVHECQPAVPQSAGALGVCELVGTSERPKVEAA
jgi:hypothetical protein